MSVKHIALALNEELGLQKRLIVCHRLFIGFYCLDLGFLVLPNLVFSFYTGWLRPPCGC